MSLDSYRYKYNISPIILTEGIAGVGGQMPLLDLIQQNAPSNYDDYFATFQPASDALLISNQVGMYPFANQTVAANAIITQPLAVSMIMTCPVREAGGYARHSSVIQALQKSLEQHNLTGGLYSIMTPASLFSACLLTSFRDISGGESKQVQYQWQLDFIKPLITLKDAQGAQNTLMQKISAGTEAAGDPPDATPS